MSRVVKKPAFCICENKDADQLRGNGEADQRLCFRYRDSTISLLPKYEISSLQPSSVAVQPGLCGTWSEPPKTGFLTTRLICWLTKMEEFKLYRKLPFPLQNWEELQNFVQGKIYHVLTEIKQSLINASHHENKFV